MREAVLFWHASSGKLLAPVSDWLISGESGTGGYVPKDSFEQKEDFLDLNGDHPHTNFRDVFTSLIGMGYHIEILSKPFTSFDAMDYGALLLLDPEEEYGTRETTKLVVDVKEKGLGLFIMADWYDDATLKKLRILDDNTHRYISPLTGGANVPALNDLLRPFGIGFGEGVLAGDWGLGGGKQTRMVNGVPIVEFPAEGRVVTARTKDESSKRSFLAPVFGVVKATGGAAGGGGYVAVYGDSNCADSAHRVSGCDWLFSEVLPLLTGSSAGGAGGSEEERQMIMAGIGKEWSAVGGKDAQGSLPPTRDAERSVLFAKHSVYWASSSAGAAGAAASGKGKGRRQAADAGGEEENGAEEVPPRFARRLPAL